MQTDQGDGHQEGRLAPRPVAEPAEHQRAQRPEAQRRAAVDKFAKQHFAQAPTASR